jgi:hypothetical protein
MAHEVHRPVASPATIRHSSFGRHSSFVIRHSSVPGGLAIAFILVLTLLSPAQATDPPPRDVYLGAGLDDESSIVFTTTLSSCRPEAIVLLDSENAGSANRLFLNAYKPVRLIPVGALSNQQADLRKRLGIEADALIEWKDGPPQALWKALMPRAERVVVCPAEPRRLLLQCASLAGTSKAPLLVLHGKEGEEVVLQKLVTDWGAKEVLAAAKAAECCRDLTGVTLTRLADEQAVWTEQVRQQAKKGPIRSLVVANPYDLANKKGSMSSLAPWVAVLKQGTLLFTNEAGDNVEAVVQAALKLPELAAADYMILVATLQAIPMERRPNPAAGKDDDIEMEPFTPKGEALCTFATGRLFHEDPAVFALLLARPRLLPQSGTPRKALVVGNPGGGLPLLETCSRNTAHELKNAGYQLTEHYGEKVKQDDVEDIMPENDIFIWEGHYRTLIDDFGFLKWKEPRPASLMFMQSCLALNDRESPPLLQRGSLGIVGASSRIYSGTGGAFTLAYFDALLYDDQTLGGALRQAKNFLLAYAQLKERRLGEKAKLSGANQRSAWAFSLWGDPTVRLPQPPKAKDALPGVRHEVKDNTIIVTLPETTYDKVNVGKFEAKMLPNSRLAGLLSKGSDEDDRVLVPFIFAEVPLPDAPKGKSPQLRTKLTDRNWIFCWDERRRTGYLLVTPRAKETELRFDIKWQE